MLCSEIRLAQCIERQNGAPKNEKPKTTENNLNITFKVKHYCTSSESTGKETRVRINSQLSIKYGLKIRYPHVGFWSRLTKTAITR